VTSKTSDQLKAELTNLFFGINAKTFAVESVSVTRGGTLTLRERKFPSVYRIKGGKPAYSEIERVFGLTDLVAISPTSNLAQIFHHPLLVELRRVAAERLALFHEPPGLEAGGGSDDR
jgi:hypothetical protein